MSTSFKKLDDLLSNNQALTMLYWLTFTLLFMLQAKYTFSSLNQIRYEELAESVRNVYWLEHHLIYDGVSSNIGWYALVLLTYKIFGFMLFSGKYLRLLISLGSLFCLATLLKHYLGLKKALVPLITIGLSPTLLYFTTLQTTYGLDLQMLPICLFLLMIINQEHRISSLFFPIYFLGFSHAYLDVLSYIYGLSAFFDLSLLEGNISARRENSRNILG